jgi:predicted  nucleic acid-binding Zn-ribbon protein
MERARKIASDNELRAIAAAGTGLVVDPFNRRWHIAACSRILAMTVSQPKWFAPTNAALTSYLQQRKALYPTAMPILACRDCGWRAQAPHARSEANPRQPRPAVIQRAANGFDVWADEYVRNESKADSAAGRVRRSVIDEIHALADPAGRVLQAGYAGRRPPGTDVENLLFNNMDQTLSLFTSPARRGIQFEDLGTIVPLAPDGTRRQSFYRYRLIELGEPFVTIELGRLVCRVPVAIVADRPARLAARIWLAVRRARPPLGPGRALGEGSFLLKVAVRALEPATTIKAIVDGVTAALQRDDPGPLTEAVGRLAPLLGVRAEELLSLAAAGDAPLGSRSRSSTTSKQSLFTLDGASQVRVTPDDDRCVAAEVVSSGTNGPPRLAVETYSVKRRPLTVNHAP